MSSLIADPLAPTKSPRAKTSVAPQDDTPALEAALHRTLPMARLEEQELPDCQGLRLALINADFPTGPLPPEVMHAVVAEPAYWAFCWGSGQALARYLFNEPDTVADKRVLDLGSGSGVAGIAAALTGAASVIACDTDKDAQLATLHNARLNEVTITLIDDFTCEAPFDVVLMADVLYDRSNLPLLNLAQQAAHCVWVADSRISELSEPGFKLRTTINALTLPNLGEFDEFGETKIWCSNHG